VQIDGVEFCEREKTQKNRQKDPHSFEHITSHPLGMGIYSISANYSSLNSLSNGIIIIESFLTNTNILVTKVGRIGKNPILGTSCGKGLTNGRKKRLLARGQFFFCVNFVGFVVDFFSEWSSTQLLLCANHLKHIDKINIGNLLALQRMVRHPQVRQISSLSRR
jgi:hypothetical protein